MCSDICARTYLFGEEEGEFRGKDNKCIFAPIGGYCVYFPSNIFATRAVFKIISLGFSKMLGTRLLSSKGKKNLCFSSNDLYTLCLLCIAL